MKTVVLILMAFTTVLAFGQHPWRGDDGTAPIGRRAMKQLNLTEDQQKQVEQMSADLVKAQIGIRAKIRTAEVDLHSLFNQDSPDKAKIVAKQKEIHQFMSDIAVNRTDFWFDVNKILNPDQQKTWKRMGLMAERGRGHGLLGMIREHFRGGRGGWGDEMER